MKHLACFVLFVLSLSAALAALPPSSAIDTLDKDYLARREARSFSQRLTPPEALIVQNSFVKKLQPSLGRPVGYKVGLVTQIGRASCRERVYSSV